MRAVFEALGVGDVVAKSLGTSNPYNMVRATFDALKSQQSPRMVAQRRGRSVAEILAKREGHGRSVGRRERQIMAEKKTNGASRRAEDVTVRQISSANRKPESRRRPCAGWAWARSAATARWKIRPSVRGMINAVKHLVEIVEEGK